MNELQAVERFLVSTLEADASVAALVGARVYAHQAPEKAVYPLILVAENASSDRNAMGADVRLFTRTTYLVKAVTRERSSMAAADAIAGAIDAALLGASGSVTIGGINYAIRGCYRTAPVRLIAGAADERYNHAGGLYRLVVQDL